MLLDDPVFLTNIGIKDCPRTSYDQYYWLKRKKLLDDVYGKSASSKLLKKLSPGDLIFWRHVEVGSPRLPRHATTWATIRRKTNTTSSAHGASRRPA